VTAVRVTDGLGAAQAARDAVVGLGGGFMISAEAKAAGRDGGYHGWSLYCAGRGGVLGPAPAEVVIAAFGFLSPRLVEPAWRAGLAVCPVEVTVARYVEVCRAWGRRRWGELAGVERLAALVARVVEEGESAGWPLYAAWRARPLPEDPPARAAQLLHVLREHRGAAHVSAVRLAGLGPLEAVVAGPGGPGNATFFGWGEQQVAAVVVDADLVARRVRAEQLTDALVAPAYGALTSAEADELTGLLASAQAAVRP
jgi:hypothetical protein